MNTLNERLEKAIELANEYVVASNKGGCKKSELKSLKSKATNALNEYNKLVELKQYKAWNEEGEPVRRAINALEIKGGKTFKYKTDDNFVMSLVVDTKDIHINLPQMQASLGKGVFADGNWFHKCEAFMSLVIDNISDVIGSTYRCNVSDISRTFKMAINPRSDEDCAKALQSVFDSILYLQDESNAGENKLKVETQVDEFGNVVAGSWETIKQRLVKDGGTCKLLLANTGKFIDFISESMHIAMTNGLFDLESDGEFEFPKSELAEEVAEPVAEEVAEPVAEETKKKSNRGRRKTENKTK